MATRVNPYPWLTIGRLLAFLALILVVLVLLVPGVPEWAGLVAVMLLAVAVLVG